MRTLYVLIILMEFIIFKYMLIFTDYYYINSGYLAYFY